MKNFFSRPSTATALAWFFLAFFVHFSVHLQAQSCTWEPVPVSGFNWDVVAESSPASGTTTGAIDLTDHVFYSQNYPGSSGTGLPNSGTVTTGSITYNLMPYNSSNALYLNSSSGTLSFLSTQSASGIGILWAGTEGGAFATVTVNFTDATSQVFSSIAVRDWFDGPSPAFIANGRVIRSSGAIDDFNTGNPRLYSSTFPLSAVHTGKLIQSVHISSSARIVVFAVAREFNCCPSFSTPGNVIINNGICDAQCGPSGASISPPSGGCPSGSSIQYSVNNGPWTTSLPTYADGLTIRTRCVCTSDPSTTSPVSSGATTNPGACTDLTPPSITCPGTQTLALGANCSASLPQYGFTAGDNCGVQGVTQSPAVGTIVSGAGPMTVTLTVTDVKGLTNQCSFTVNKVDITPPSITCPATQSLILDANCSGTLLDYRSLATVGDNCGVQSVTQSPAAGTIVNGAGPTSVTLTVTDINGLTNQCTFTVSKVDNIPPTAVCSNSFVTFNGQESIALNANTLVTANDNCGIQSITLSPSSITCQQLGQTVPVTITVRDLSNNTATCTSNITVGGLPCGWSQQPNGVNCINGNNVTFSPPTGVFTVTSTNCHYAPGFTSDSKAFAQRTLCGNGSITALVTDISSLATGWAGIVMRESNAAGAKKAQLITNLSNLSRREFRTATNGSAQPQQFPSNERYWLRITRTGNQFVMYASPNGTAWFVVGSQNIVMPSCIQMGLVVTNYTPTSTVTATFSNVSFTGTNIGLGTGGGSMEQSTQSIEMPHSFEVYPNPTSGELNVNLTAYLGRSVRIETYSLEGKLLQFSELDEVQNTLERLDLKGLESGMYLVKVKSAGLPDITKRVVKQ